MAVSRRARPDTWLLTHGFRERPSNSRRGLIQALGALRASRTTCASAVLHLDEDAPDTIFDSRSALEAHGVKLFSVVAARFSLAVLAPTAAIVLALHLLAVPTPSEGSLLTPWAEPDPSRAMPDSLIHTAVQPGEASGDGFVALRRREETSKVVTITATGRGGSYNLECLTTAERAEFDILVVRADQVVDVYRQLCSPPRAGAS
jgi:hypothetical protein